MICPCCCCKFALCAVQCKSCCCDCGPFGLSLLLAFFFGFCAVALFVFQISAVAGCATFCSLCMSEIGGEESCDYCFSDGPYAPNLITSRICPLRNARAGVGSAAGLTACGALIAAGNFAFLARAARPSTAISAPTPAGATIVDGTNGAALP